MGGRQLANATTKKGFIKYMKKSIVGSVFAPSGGDDSSDSEDEDPRQLAAAEAAEKERKRAGVPEILPDSLLSALAPKMMILSYCIKNIVLNQVGFL